MRPSDQPSPLVTILFAGCAGAMGWGIRGQYGHETGAMLAGLLVGLVLVVRLCPLAHPLAAARAAGLCAAAVGFGGAMTYGQTIGFTQNPQVIGNWTALGWGMLGLALKGALWIGFAGAFLGIGLSRLRYPPGEILLLLGGVMLLALLGIWMLNLPYDPAHRVLPRIYFSADWTTYPLAGDDLKPRREVWGGFLLAFIGLVAYLGCVRRDSLARNLAIWGALGGLGFPLGQTLQAGHAWNLEFFQSGLPARIEPYLNWWNFMETTFGLVWGISMGFGAWLNRHSLSELRDSPEVRLSLPLETALFVVQMVLLGFWDFGSVKTLDELGDLGIPMSIIPIVAVAAGRLWPFLMCLPVVAFPILGKTALELNLYATRPVLGVAFVALPSIALTWTALRFYRDSDVAIPRRMLLLTTWLYFGLNFLMFKMPWPWAPWTIRTPNALVFLACALALTWAACRPRARRELA